VRKRNGANGQERRIHWIDAKKKTSTKIALLHAMHVVNALIERKSGRLVARKGNGVNGQESRIRRRDAKILTSTKTVLRHAKYALLKYGYVFNRQFLNNFCLLEDF